jgi:hypothetical protein
MFDRGSTSHSTQNINDALVGVSRAIELAGVSTVGTAGIKARIRALCAEARHSGTPVEALIIGLRRTVAFQSSLQDANHRHATLPHDAISYLIETYYATDR